MCIDDSTKCDANTTTVVLPTSTSSAQHPCLPDTSIEVREGGLDTSAHIPKDEAPPPPYSCSPGQPTNSAHSPKTTGLYRSCFLNSRCGILKNVKFVCTWVCSEFQVCKTSVELQIIFLYLFRWYFIW